MPRLLDDPNDPRWLEAERRDIYLRDLSKENDWTAARDVVEAVRNEFRIGRSTVYRLFRFQLGLRLASTGQIAFNDFEVLTEPLVLVLSIGRDGRGAPQQAG